MNKKLYFTLAKNNMKKNKNTFFPFILSSTTMIALFYMMAAIYGQTSASSGFYGDASVKKVLQLGVWVCGIFAAGVIFYTNSFLMRQRGKELGLYSILGMEKSHIRKVLFWENAIAGCGSILAGLFFGILFSKLMFLILIKLAKIQAAIAFRISFSDIALTVLIFAGVFVLNMIQNVIKLHCLNPMELLRSSKQGEKEPKAKWIQAIIALACLGSGYYIAVTTQSPLKALTSFFGAVMLVMVGTYLLFQCGSVAWLKLLKKNKNYYYHKTHFITLSGMMYRMKRNATGLANICILSTAVLVILSSTISLYVGINDSLTASYPRDVQTSYMCPTKLMRETELDGEAPLDEGQLKETIEDYAAENNVKVLNPYKEYSFFTFVKETEENKYQLEVEGLTNIEDVIFIGVQSLEAYNESVEKEARLTEVGEHEVWCLDSKDLVADGSKISLCGEEFETKSISDAMETSQSIRENFEDEFFGMYDSMRCMLLFVSDGEELEKFADRVNAVEREISSDGVSEIQFSYEFDLEGELEDKQAFCSGLRDQLYNAGIPHVATVSDVFSDQEYYGGLYATIFFIGIFIGLMFLMTTVLIIYYKQLSEGYEDRERFKILQKVGMDKTEVKRVITTQILQVFFLPLLLASVHIAFAFPSIKGILAILGLVNVPLFVGCTIGTIVIFALVYGIVYYLTAKTYYKIVYS